MEPVDNNQFELKPNTKSKRKITTPCPNAYLNPALNLLANEDPICNTAMEVVPNKKRKRTRSCDIASFENSALDLGISRAAVNEFLARELENVRRNLKQYDSSSKNDDKENLAPNLEAEPIYMNLIEKSKDVPWTDISFDQSTVNNPITIQEVAQVHKDSITNMNHDINDLSSIDTTKKNNLNYGMETLDVSTINSTTNMQTNVTNNVFINNSSNLSFIDRLTLDSPGVSNQSLFYDDDLNESNIMEIKTITIITKKKRVSLNGTNTNPFLEPNFAVDMTDNISNALPENPFAISSSSEANYMEEVGKLHSRPSHVGGNQENHLLPRRLFTGDTNSTISTVNESLMKTDTHEYENIDSYRSESPIYENVGDETINQELPYNKQSKVLGFDVSKFNSVDIMDKNNQNNSSNEYNDTKKDFKHHILKASNKLSKKVLKTIKKTFKSEKGENNVTLNPYEVPRKPPKQKTIPKDTGIENLALNLDNSDEIEMEELDKTDEHKYETIKTIRNTRLNMNATPLKQRCHDSSELSQSKNSTPGKKVRFDSTLNKEKVITGNSFDCDIQSPGFDAKIDKYHDELENCINERKFIQQNM